MQLSIFAIKVLHCDIYTEAKRKLSPGQLISVLATAGSLVKRVYLFVEQKYDIPIPNKVETITQ